MPDPLRDISRTIGQAKAELDKKKQKKKKSKKSTKTDQEPSAEPVKDTLIPVDDPEDIPGLSEMYGELVGDTEPSDEEILELEQAYQEQILEEPESPYIDYAKLGEEAMALEEEEREALILEYEQSLVDDTWELTPEDTLEIDEVIHREIVAKAESTQTEILVPDPKSSSKPARVPSGHVGRKFFHKDELWELNPGGARSINGVQRALSREVLDLIVRSEGLVVLEEEPLRFREPTEEESARCQTLSRGTPKIMEPQGVSVPDDIEIDFDRILLDAQANIQNIQGKDVKSNVDVKDFFKWNKRLIEMKFPTWKAHDVELVGMLVLASLFDAKYMYRDKFVPYGYPSFYVIIIGEPSTNKSGGLMETLDAVLHGKHDRPLILLGFTKEAAEIVISGVNEESGVDESATRSGNRAIILYKDECVTIFNPELGVSYDKPIKEWMIQQYDNRTLSRVRVDSKNDFIINTSCFNFVGTIQPDRFNESVDYDDVYSGMFGRVTYIMLKDDAKVPVHGEFTAEINEIAVQIGEMSERIARAGNHISYNKPAMFKLSPSGYEILNKFTIDLYLYCGKQGKEMASVFRGLSKRLFTLIKKFATCYQVLDEISKSEYLEQSKDNFTNYIISDENLKRAIQLGKHCWKVMEDRLSKIESGPMAKNYRRVEGMFDDPKMRPFQTKYGRVLRERDVVQRTKWGSRVIDDMMKSFTLAQRYFRWDVETTVGKKMTWVWAEFSKISEKDEETRKAVVAHLNSLDKKR